MYIRTRISTYCQRSQLRQGQLAKQKKGTGTGRTSPKARFLQHNGTRPAQSLASKTGTSMVHDEWIMCFLYLPTYTMVCPETIHKSTFNWMYSWIWHWRKRNIKCISLKPSAVFCNYVPSIYRPVSLLLQIPSASAEHQFISTLLSWRERSRTIMAVLAMDRVVVLLSDVLRIYVQHLNLGTVGIYLCTRLPQW